MNVNKDRFVDKSWDHWEFSSGEQNEEDEPSLKDEEDEPGTGESAKKH